MQFLDREIWKYGGTLLQAEDEIAGIGAVVGASFAGKKAMTATSGPGMSLKTEMLGLASIAELPLVCVNVQRGGPSTGMPTKAEQSDLFQAAFSAHGDCLRPVLAPTSVGDMFGITVEAFNLAEYYQTPVIVLSDQEISQRKETVEPIDTSTFRLVERRRPTEAELAKYARFKLTESGISPISHPGMPGGNYLASGIEHNELGRPTASGEMHARMNEKRFRKFNPLKNRRDLFVVEGDPDAPIGLVSWGSVAGRGEGSAAAGPGGRVAREIARAQTALPGGRTGVPGLLRVGHAGVVHRAILPGATLPAGQDVRGPSGPGQTAGQERIQPNSTGGSARTAARNGRRAPRQPQPPPTRSGRRLTGESRESIMIITRTHSGRQVPGR